MGDPQSASERTVVIGFDGSEQGLDALALGGLFADCFHATPVIASVLPFPPDLLSSEEQERFLGFETDEHFAVARERLSPRDSRDRVVVGSSAAKGLYELAGEEGAIAIVVGSTHRGPLGRVLPGAVGANLLQGAPCAVAVAPRGYTDRDRRSVGRVVVGFDGSAEASAALQIAAGIARQSQGTLILTTAVEPPHSYGWGEALAALAEGDIRTREQTRKQQILERGLEDVPDGVEVEDRLVDGEVADVLSGAAKDADLLVVGSRSYGPVARTFLGSASRALVERAQCPVLVVPRAGLDGARSLAG